MVSTAVKIMHAEYRTQMVDRALQLLTLHIMWKARSLPAAAELSPDEVQFRDKLKEERESLLEKLVEFAVGTQSNTVEGVRRAVRHDQYVAWSTSVDLHGGLGIPGVADLAHPLLRDGNNRTRWQSASHRGAALVS